jgi:hypothetical protein
MPVYQSQQFSNVHFGHRHNLNNSDGVRQAILELDSVRRILQTRAKMLDRGEAVGGVGVEPPSSDEEDEGEEDEDEEDEDEEDEDEDRIRPNTLTDPFEDDEEDSCVEEDTNEEAAVGAYSLGAHGRADASGFTLNSPSSVGSSLVGSNVKKEDEDVHMSNVDEPILIESSPETDWEGFED